MLQEPTASILWVMTEVAITYETLLSTRPYSITAPKIRTRIYMQHIINTAFTTGFLSDLKDSLNPFL
jgi:hypothetical protein